MMLNHSWFSAAKALLSAVLLSVPLVASTALPEPDTLIYGSVIDRHTGGQDYRVTEGTVRYTIVDERTGSEFNIEAELAPMAGGLSYRLAIPHETVTGGLTSSEGSYPLDANGSVFRIVAVHLGDTPTRILPPASPEITASQLLRASAHRLDLEVALDLLDSDGDGIPDWWESSHGLNSSDAADAGRDGDGDGISNLGEFFAGTDPNEADLSPSLADARLIVYPDKLSGVYLAANDADTPAGELTYEIVTLPLSGTLSRRIVGETDQPEITDLATGATFTGTDLEFGRIVYQIDPLDPAIASFGVRVNDGTTGHSPAEATVTLLPFEPQTSPQASTLRDQIASSTRNLETIIWDLELLASSANVLPAAATQASPLVSSLVFIGTPGDDHFSGTGGADHFYGGIGDDHFTGGRGSDTFGVVNALRSSGDDVVADFNLAEGDVLDLRFALIPSSSGLSNYVQLSVSDDTWRLDFDTDGDGSGFVDGSITLTGFNGAASPAELWNTGALLLPQGIFPETRLSFNSELTEASENGPTSARVSLLRSGDLSGPLTVAVQISGSATNGVDYASLPDSFTFAPQQSALTITVEPFADDQTEPTEIVEIRVLESPDYALPQDSAAFRIQIADLLPELQLERFAAVATLAPKQSATIFVHRSGATGTSVLARLKIAGSAAPGIDYTALPSFITFPSGSTSQAIQIETLDTADLSGPKTVHITIQPHETYLIGDTPVAQVSLIDRLTTLADWRATHFPDATTTDLETFASQTTPNGLTHLQLYAFGIAPNTSAAASLAQLKLTHSDDGNILIDYTRPPAVSDIRYTLESSTGLGSWSPADDHLERLWPASAPAGLVRFHAIAPQKSLGTRFFRLTLSLQ